MGNLAVAVSGWPQNRLRVLLHCLLAGQAGEIEISRVSAVSSPLLSEILCLDSLGRGIRGCIPPKSRTKPGCATLGKCQTQPSNHEEQPNDPIFEERSVWTGYPFVLET